MSGGGAEGWRAFPLVNGPTRSRNLGLNFFKADVASAQFFVTDERITEHHFFLSTDRPQTCDADGLQRSLRMGSQASR
jgi:hypothetical protein